MIAQDVLDDASEVLGYCQDAVLFRRLTDAIEVLANKGQWNPLLGYMDIKVANGYYVTLPPDVECPLKININGQPSFSRSRIFEFTLNAPGAEMPDTTNFAWEDQGDEPVLMQPDTARIIQVLGDAADTGQLVHIQGLDTSNVLVDRSLKINGTVIEHQTLAPLERITAVHKNVTKAPVTLQAANGLVLSVYGKTETNPNYRRIKLSKPAAQIRMLFRRVTYKITSADDFIPLHSKMALILMLKALEAYRRPADVQNAASYEAQALKWITEEQASSNAALEIAQQSEDDTATGAVYRDGSILVVSDIYDEASKVFGPVGRGKLFDRITDAIQMLTNKAPWDATLAYLDIRVGQGNVVVLPEEVDAPIAININGQPSFARDRTFEFTLNTPGSTMQDTAGFTWDDRANTPVFGDILVPGILFARAENAADDGKTLKVYGIGPDGRNQTEKLTLSSSIDRVGAKIFKTITRVSKDTTIGFVQLNMTHVAHTQDGDSVTLSRYYPGETEPSYRRIKLSVSAPAVRILFKRKTNKVSSLDDLIPLGSKFALAMAMRAVATYMAGDAAKAKDLEDSAARLLKEQQDSHNSMAISPELTATNQTINNRDSIIVADVYDEASMIFGPIGKPRLFDKITEAVEALANEGQWDGLDGYVDIVTDCGYYVTLPRYVETPLALNLGGRPMIPRNRFFEFHLNGPGSDCQTSGRYFDIMDDVCTLMDPPGSNQLYATSELVADRGLRLRVFGYDQRGRRVLTREGNTWIEGAYIPITTSGKPAALTPFFSRIERIEKPASAGFITLYSFTPPYGDSGASSYRIGYYYPDETEPSYKRLKLAQSCAWVRLRYRKRFLKVSGMYEPLHLKSKTAIVQMMKAIDALSKGDYKVAEAASVIAVRMLTAEQVSRNPTDTFSFQFDTRIHMSDPRKRGIR